MLWLSEVCLSDFIKLKLNDLSDVLKLREVFAPDSIWFLILSSINFILILDSFWYFFSRLEAFFVFVGLGCNDKYYWILFMVGTSVLLTVNFKYLFIE